MAQPKVRVLREGKEAMIDATQLVPGDILLVEAGDKISADARVIQSHSLEAAEAVLTGESLPVEKSATPLSHEVPLADQTSMLFAGTIITKGRGMAVITAIGMQTEIGKIAGMLQEAPEKQTKLQYDINALSKWLGIVVLGICVVVFVMNIFLVKEGWQEAFFIAIALAVAAIPEGLPAVFTITLGIGVHKLVQKHALVKKLSSVETLGSVNVICTDKTGTLTQNEMTVVSLFVNNQVYPVKGIGYQEISPTHLKERNDTLTQLLRIGILCNSSQLVQGQPLGDPTEIALLVSAKKG
jgi:Ca2+-transporting ATPase